MPKKCIIRGCKDNSGTLFPFPIDKPRVFLKWIQALEKHQPLPTDDYVGTTICSAHFVESDFLKTKKNQINKKSVPSIFPDIPDEGEVPVIDIKIEPEDEGNITSDVVREKNLRRNRLTIPITEPDSEEGASDGSDYEPYGYRDEGDIESEESEIDNILENSHDNRDVDEKSRLNDSDTSVANEPVNPETGIEETKDSDCESVTQTSSLDVLKEKLAGKTETLRAEENTLQCMQEMISNQAKTINKLQKELDKLLRLDAEQQRNDESSGDDHGDTNTPASSDGLVDKLRDYCNVDLQTFAIALYYFSPSVYAYLRSIMAYLPPKNVVIDWVTSGHAFSLFPIGVLEKEKFILE